MFLFYNLKLRGSLYMYVWDRLEHVKGQGGRSDPSQLL